MWLDHLLTMMPTLKQIKKINELLLEYHFLKIPPSGIVFSELEGKPRVCIMLEPIHDLQHARWYYMDWQGELEENNEQ